MHTKLMNKLLSVAALTALLAGCGEGQVSQPQNAEADTVKLTRSGMPVLPSASGTGALTPWGGTNSQNWRPEAIVANATSEALNAAWDQADVADAVVAVPAKLYGSDFYEFGDGQANAVPSFEGWHSVRPPVVATLVRFKSAPTQLQVKFDRDLSLTSGALEVTYNAGSGWKTAAITATKNASGDFAATWTVPAELGWDSLLSKQVALIHPKGWSDWFPLWFRANVRTTADLYKTVPANKATFTDGRSIVDHEGVTSQGTSTSQTPFGRLSSHDYQGRYNQNPYNPQDIHARFPYNGQQIVTGVGQGWTWVANQPPAPFKVMYTCFQRRQPAAEASAPNGGVPSGGGWHRIGDPAETILNDLEAGPLVVGSAMSNPLPASLLPSGGFAFNLSDVVVIRWLKPGEAFITPQGQGYTDASGNYWDQANFHWYYFSQSTEVCTEEWVHQTRPTDTLDFAPQAGATTPVNFEVDNATTNWGQDVYVVGDSDALGAWDTSKAVKLDASAYPSWTGTINLATNTTVNFKFIKKDGSGYVVWESGNDHALSVAPGAQAVFSWQ